MRPLSDSGQPALGLREQERRASEQRTAMVAALIGPLVHKLSNLLLAVSGLAELAARRPNAPESGENLRLVSQESQRAMALLRALAELAKPAGRETVTLDAVPRIGALVDALRPWLQEQQVELALKITGSALGRWPERALEQSLLLLLLGPWFEGTELPPGGPGEPAPVGRDAPGAYPGSAGSSGSHSPRPVRRARLVTRTRRGLVWLSGVMPLPESWLPGHSRALDLTQLPGLRLRVWRRGPLSWRGFAFPLAQAGVGAAGVGQALRAPQATVQSSGSRAPEGALPSAAAQATNPAPSRPLPTGGMRPANRVLLIGGPESQLTAEVLAEAGYRVEHAQSLGEARRLLELLTPDLLLAEDPVGAPGAEWLRLSGEAQAVHGTRLGQLAAGAGLPAPRLPAPVRPAELLAFVQRLLAASPAAPLPSRQPEATPPPAQPWSGRWS